MTADCLIHCRSLPDDLFIEILLRLPVRSLLQLKCVCKSWKTLISDSQFAKRHLQMLTVDPSITNPQFFFGRGDGKILSLPVKPLLESPSEPTKAVEFSMEPRFGVLGSCNGLVCLLDIDEGYVILWNPSTRFKSNKSPSLNLLFDKWDVLGYGFGYDHVNDKYKVLVDVRHHGNIGYNENVRLYTFGENSWKNIQNFPSCPTRFRGKFVSGTLNWVIVRQDGGYSRITVLSFDLVKESYTEILLPQNQKHDGWIDARPMLGVLDNCLCLSFDTRTHLVLWLMKEYGVVESWTRLGMIFAEPLPGPYSVIEPLFINENSIVLLRTMNAFFLYDLNNGRLVIPLISTSVNMNQFLYLESLVSPQL
ncbi:F-box/kelch-repeat protein At3g23880-like [Vicia villosa]|uniref:F-box/kelch-repeat protein At3g23880-like n=1 Tax=Vicia villosa TaxID=3911 RepID=UPI00273CE2CE|nr:F-box/kelch-repeat protein At3g23880-like [Vicia villosa]